MMGRAARVDDLGQSEPGCDGDASRAYFVRILRSNMLSSYSLRFRHQHNSKKAWDYISPRSSLISACDSSYSFWYLSACSLASRSSSSSACSCLYLATKSVVRLSASPERHACG